MNGFIRNTINNKSIEICYRKEGLSIDVMKKICC